MRQMEVFLFSNNKSQKKEMITYVCVIIWHFLEIWIQQIPFVLSHDIVSWKLVLSCLLQIFSNYDLVLCKKNHKLCRINKLLMNFVFFVFVSYDHYLTMILVLVLLLQNCTLFCIMPSWFSTTTTSSMNCGWFVCKICLWVCVHTCLHTYTYTWMCIWIWSHLVFVVLISKCPSMTKFLHSFYALHSSSKLPTTM